MEAGLGELTRTGTRKKSESWDIRMRISTLVEGMTQRVHWMHI